MAQINWTSNLHVHTQKLIKYANIINEDVHI